MVEMRSAYKQGKQQAKTDSAQQKFALLQTRGIWRYALVDSLLISTALAIGGAIAGRGLGESLFSFVLAFVMIAVWRTLGWKKHEQEALHEQGKADGAAPKFYGRLRIILFVLALCGPLLYVTMDKPAPTPTETNEPALYTVPQPE